MPLYHKHACVSSHACLFLRVILDESASLYGTCLPVCAHVFLWAFMHILKLGMGCWGSVIYPVVPEHPFWLSSLYQRDLIESNWDNYSEIGPEEFIEPVICSN